MSQAEKEFAGRFDGNPPLLSANGKTLNPAPRRLAPLSPTPPDTPFEEIGARYREDGYVWLKHFLDSQKVQAFRGRVFSHLGAAGLVATDADPALGIAGSGPIDKSLADQILMGLVRSARFEAFCMQPELLELMEWLVEGLAYLHRRKIMRYTLPASGVATPAHYDLVYLRGGTSRIVTAWIPIGDIPAQMGGLVYLEGSHAIGQKMEAEFAQKAADLSPQERISAFNRNMTEGGWVSKDLPDMAERFDTRWLYADYEAGDVMLHSPYMIHASTSNEDAGNRIRLSTDIRYQNVEDEIDARWSNHWSLGDML